MAVAALVMCRWHGNFGASRVLWCLAVGIYLGGFTGSSLKSLGQLGCGVRRGRFGLVYIPRGGIEDEARAHALHPTGCRDMSDLHAKAWLSPPSGRRGRPWCMRCCIRLSLSMWLWSEKGMALLVVTGMTRKVADTIPICIMSTMHGAEKVQVMIAGNQGLLVVTACGDSVSRDQGVFSHQLGQNTMTSENMFGLFPKAWL